jgi:DNA mismatch repair ATPase MutL
MRCVQVADLFCQTVGRRGGLGVPTRPGASVTAESCVVKLVLGSILKVADLFKNPPLRYKGGWGLATASEEFSHGMRCVHQLMASR